MPRTKRRSSRGLRGLYNCLTAKGKLKKGCKFVNGRAVLVFHSRGYRGRG